MPPRRSLTRATLQTRSRTRVAPNCGGSRSFMAEQQANKRRQKRPPKQ